VTAAGAISRPRPGLRQLRRVRYRSCANVVATGGSMVVAAVTVEVVVADVVGRPSTQAERFAVRRSVGGIFRSPRRPPRAQRRRQEACTAGMTRTCRRRVAVRRSTVLLPQYRTSRRTRTPPPPMPTTPMPVPPRAPPDKGPNSESAASATKSTLPLPTTANGAVTGTTVAAAAVATVTADSRPGAGSAASLADSGLLGSVRYCVLSQAEWC
jgi:hypothetical protein